jgi:hypothetical protein
MSSRRKPGASKLADEVLVSVGSAVIAGERVRGIALQKRGALTLLFLRISEPDRLLSASTWTRLPVSCYTATANPVDEQLIKMPGVSGHLYVVDDPA